MEKGGQLGKRDGFELIGLSVQVGVKVGAIGTDEIRQLSFLARFRDEDLVVLGHVEDLSF